ncbi:MAG: alpha-2-macroglobulin [Nitrospinae bacterium]|nr:alpha-2-macroglobulin [Nitrospinota bacterium]
MRSVRFLLAWLLLLVPFSGAVVGSPADPSAPHVVQFTPQGTVKRVRQVSVRFSEAMVPLGDPRRASDPFEIDCPAPGTARWLDTLTWVYDFARNLPGGVRCAFQLQAGLTSLAGHAVEGQAMFAFSTGGPAIQSSTPSEGASWIDEEQAFLLVLDAEPTEASVLAHVSFSIQGIPERVGVRLLDTQAREAILKRMYRGFASGPVVALQARQSFPNGARLSLIWGKGITSESGVATEQDQVLSFKSREAFTATFHCERENRRAGCIPVTPMTIKFTAPVPWEQARQISLVGPGGQRWKPEADKEQALFVERVGFKGPFPEATAFRVEVPVELRDDAGRSLMNADKFPLRLRTGEAPPLAKFPTRFGILEWKADPAMPVTVRNLEPEIQARVMRVEHEAHSGSTETSQEPSEQVKGRVQRLAAEDTQEILAWLRKVAVATRETSVFGPGDPERALKAFLLPKPNGARPFEVIGIPLEAPGLYIAELESDRLGASLLDKPRPMYVPTAALVTNMSVHFKWGREASLAWVTTLNEGRPVAKAQVAVHDCRGMVLWKGETDRQGIARIGRLPTRSALPRCTFGGGLFHYDYEQVTALRDLDQDLFITAQVQDDLSFVHSSWERGIEPWRFQLPPERYQGPLVVHTLFDRPLFRAGETVHMKHVLRTQTMRGFSLAPDKQRPALLSIRHVGSDEKYELPLRWDAAGIAENTWPIPKEAKLGAYEVVLVRAPLRKGAPRPGPQGSEGEVGRESSQEWTSGQFRVEEFRVPLMKGSIRLPAQPQVAVSEIPVDLGVQYLAGGGAEHLPVTLRAQLRPKHVPSFDAFEHFTFANGYVKEGIARQEVSGEEEMEDEEGAEAPLERLPQARRAVHERQELVLDAAGTARTSITHLPRASTPLEVLAELEFRDPNGEVQTISAKVPLWPARWLVGIKPDSWVASRESLKAQVAVAEVSGTPVGGASVQVELLERKSYSHRKRLVGGFYAYEHVEETRRVGELCQGVTNAQGVLFCEGKPPVDGNLVLQASLTGESRNTTAAHQEVWVAGSRDWWFKVQDSDRIDLLPEKRRYEPGETALLQVRAPFREATALVTVEREGILEAFVTPLSGKEPVVKVPVRDHYAPNIFISVLAVRGRVGGVQPTAMVDLGRPSYKLGVAEIRVGWRAHELLVKVSTDQATYRVREKAIVRIAVQTASGQPPPPRSEVAVVAVDEGLLELLPNESWNLLEAMMGQRGYGIRTATAQMQVVGKRHYGLKALRQAGGGGRQVTRELFDTLLLWKGRVPLDAGGDASLEVPLNDSLTSFRIVAVATGGVSLFGSGSTTIRSTQDLMVLPGIAPLVREGDRFRSEFTLRNTTDHPQDVVVQGRVEEIAEPLTPQAFTLAAGEARTVGWDLTAPVGVQALRYDMEAGQRGGPTDRVRVVQQVAPAVPVRTFQATLSQWKPGMHLPVERPVDALPDRGGVQVTVGATLSEGLDGVREWMRRYPYTCLEQRVSRAVALRDESLWRDIASTLGAYQDSDGLLKYFPSMGWGSEVLTSYVLAISHEAGWTIPATVQERLVQGLQKFVQGAILRRSALPTVDLSLRKLAALEALARHGKADPALLGSVTIEPNLWPTSAVLDWWSLLDRVPGIARRQARLQEAEHIMRARLNLQGTMLGFSTERSDSLWWLMVSTDSNALRLLLNLLEAGRWKEDLPRLLHAALARQRRGAWDLTVANAWGALAVEKFSQAFERTPVSGQTTVSLLSATQQAEWTQDPQGKTLAFPWPAKSADLVVEHAGSGQPWVTLQARSAIPLQAPLSSGYRIRKTVTPIEPRQPGRWTRGDLARVRLTLEAQSDMTWVVISDPIPAGASHLGTGLARDSQIAIAGETAKGQVWPAFEERAFEAFRAYFEYVPKGALVVEYTIRLNQSGQFHLPPTRAEALYAPEMFGELPNASLEVHP